MFNNLLNIFTKPAYKKIEIEDLPSQGYFYPKGVGIKIKKGDIEDQIEYNHVINTSNIFDVTDTVKSILKRNIKISPNDFHFEQIRAIDIYFLFIEFVKYSKDDKIFFDTIEFKPSNFVYYNFEKYIKNYDEETNEFVFYNWRYSIPSIGVETSINKFSYELAIKGLTEEYQNKNYNLIYFLGKKYKLSFEEMVNLIDIFEDLDEEEQDKIDEIVNKFSKSGLYILMEEDKKPVRINPNMLRKIWK
jgi:hypothetical protein